MQNEKKRKLIRKEKNYQFNLFNLKKKTHTLGMKKQCYKIVRK